MYRRLVTHLFRSIRPAECRSIAAQLPHNAVFSWSAQPACLVTAIQQKRSYAMVRKMGQSEVPKPKTKKEIEDKVLLAIKKWDRFPSDRLEKLTLGARFVEDLGFDSLDLIEIIMAIEDEFNHEMSDEQNEKFKTPSDIVKYFCEIELMEMDDDD